MTRPSVLAALVLLSTFVVAACGGAGSPIPSTSPGATPAPSGPLSADEAAALVLADSPQFAGIGPHDPDLIGQDRWYEVGPGTTGFLVTVVIGWGDCPSGCINRHTWRYEVTPDRTVRLVEETGQPLPATFRAPVAGGPGIAGYVLAGPVCPVITDPPDPACADRPVAGAEIVVHDASGTEVARAFSARDGTYAIGLAPGSYTVAALPVEGLMVAPQAQPVTVPDSAKEPIQVDLVYDTGIR
jgi:hypothetical protein